ncbi:hypothetical protein [Rhodovulum tesquicola]|nr:hypothetical protein [Rhodovulum tesquicola]
MAAIIRGCPGTALSIPMQHEKEKEAYALGEALFCRRASMLDYS